MDRYWGTSLRHWLQLPQTHVLLDRLHPSDAEFVSWNSGGCRVLACALYEILRRLPAHGLPALKILATDQSPVDHVVLQITTPANGAWYLDADGATRLPSLLKRFAKREARTNPRLINYNEELLDQYEIQCPATKLFALIKALESTINYW